VLRTNLSTRPFFNERAVHAAAAAVAALAILVAGWQVTRIVQLSRDKTEYNNTIRRDKAAAEAAEREAAQIRRGLDQQELAAVSDAAAEANDLIERRTFSWTQLFNQLQATLPEDVMLTSIHPEFKDGVTTLNFDLQGKNAENVDEFWDHLEKTGAFHDIQWSNVQATDEGFRRIQMKAVYTAHGGSGPQPASVSDKPAEAQPQAPAAAPGAPAGRSGAPQPPGGRADAPTGRSDAPQGGRR
jgi:Tfp pilus assembly protein PilN